MILKPVYFQALPPWPLANVSEVVREDRVVATWPPLPMMLTPPTSLLAHGTEIDRWIDNR